MQGWVVIIGVLGSNVGSWAGIVGTEGDTIDDGIPCMVKGERRVARAGGNVPEDLEDGVDAVVVNVVMTVVMAEPLDEVAWTEVEAEEGC